MATFANLKSDIAAWMRRGDLTSVLPSFVALAEIELFRTSKPALRVSQMETSADLTVTANAATIPDDYLDGRYLTKDSGDVLSYVPPEAFSANSYMQYTVIGRTVVLPSSIGGTVTLHYYAIPDALSADADTNDTLNAFYSAYLVAALKQAHLYVKDAAAAQVAEQQLYAIITAANNSGKNLAAGSMQVRAG